MTKAENASFVAKCLKRNNATANEVALLYLYFDTDGDGRVSQREYLGGWLATGGNFNIVVMEFMLHDTQRNEFLEGEELIALFGSLGGRGGAGSADVATMMSAFDTSGDGKMNEAEYTEMVVKLRSRFTLLDNSRTGLLQSGVPYS